MASTNRGNDYLFNTPGGPTATLILAHGAGAPMDSEFMSAFAEGLSRQGIEVIRFEFPYMKKHRVSGTRTPPDGKAVLLDVWKSIIDEFQNKPRLFIGGKSMGGRMAAEVARERTVSGVVCLGYPFHPAGKPDQTRLEPLQVIRCPALIIQGTRDPLGSIEEVQRYELSNQVKVHWLDDGDHDFKPRIRSGYTEQILRQNAISIIVEFIDAHG